MMKLTANVYAVGPMTGCDDPTVAAYVDIIPDDVETWSESGDDDAGLRVYCTIEMAREIAPFLLGGTIEIGLVHGVIKDWCVA
jgi:hypothetical protein